MAKSRWTVRTATAADDAELRVLFAAVFGHPIDRAQWLWKYADAPVRGMLLRRNGGADDGKAVAFFGGMPRTLFSPEGLPIQAVQNGDVMVLPSERGVFSRQGALYQVAAAFLGQHVGPGKAYAFAFGFPNGRHFQLGITLGLYAHAGRLSELSWSAAAAAATLVDGNLPNAAAGVDCQAIDSCNPAPVATALHTLFTDMRASWPQHFIGQRNAQRWQTRFVQHPQHRYTILLVMQKKPLSEKSAKKASFSWLRRFFGQKPAAQPQPLCAVVLREHPGHVEWLDFVGSRDAIASAVACVRSFAARACAGKHVMALLSSEIAADFAGDAASCQLSDIHIPVNARPVEEAIQHPRAYIDRLWLMGGDTDFL